MPGTCSWKKNCKQSFCDLGSQIGGAITYILWQSLHLLAFQQCLKTLRKQFAHSRLVVSTHQDLIFGFEYREPSELLHWQWVLTLHFNTTWWIIDIQSQHNIDSCYECLPAETLHLELIRVNFYVCGGLNLPQYWRAPAMKRVHPTWAHPFHKRPCVFIFRVESVACITLVSLMLLHLFQIKEMPCFLKTLLRQRDWSSHFWES